MSQTVTVDIPKAFWLTSNMRLHWAAKAKRAAWIRARAGYVALHELRNCALEPMLAADVTVWVGYPANRRQDADNSAPAVKACIDGIVTDAGLLPDDDATHRPATTYRRDQPTGRPGWYRLRLEFTPTEQEQQA